MTRRIGKMRWFLALLVLCGVLLGGCVARQDGDLAPLRDAVQHGTLDSRAAGECSDHITFSGDAPLAAAIDMNVNTLRHLAGQVGAKNHWDDGLPPGDSTYVALCIFDLSQLDPRPGDYVADWLSEDADGNGGQGLVRVWT